MQRFHHRAGIGIVGWRQSGAADVAATLAPRDHHRRIVTRGRHGRAVATGGGGASGIPTLSAATAINITATTATPQVVLTF